MMPSKVKISYVAVYGSYTMTEALKLALIIGDCVSL